MKWISIILVIFLGVSGVADRPALGDGGIVRLSETVEEVTITVMTAPASLHVGVVDVSVMITEAATGTVVLDARVDIELQRRSGGAVPIDASATRSAATNKLLYEARISLPIEGVWEATVAVDMGGGIRTVSCAFPVAPPPGPWIDHWPWLVAPLLAIGLMMMVGIPRSGGVPC